MKAWAQVMSPFPIWAVCLCVCWHTDTRGRPWLSPGEAQGPVLQPCSPLGPAWPGGTGHTAGEWLPSPAGTKNKPHKITQPKPEGRQDDVVLARGWYFISCVCVSFFFFFSFSLPPPALPLVYSRCFVCESLQFCSCLRLPPLPFYHT